MRTRLEMSQAAYARHRGVTKQPLWRNLAIQPMGTLGNYLRVRRREWQLSQRELAFLLGYKNESIVSRLERQERRLTFDTWRACRLIFGTRSDEMFPALSQAADDELLSRIAELRADLERDKPSKRLDAKLRLLLAIEMWLLRWC